MSRPTREEVRAARRRRQTRPDDAERLRVAIVEDVRQRNAGGPDRFLVINELLRQASAACAATKESA